jgi:hypothetical protein
MDRFQRCVDHACAIDRRNRQPGGEYPAEANQTLSGAKEDPADAEDCRR